MVHGRSNALRANRILVATPAVEEHIDDAIRAYVSQEKIIENLVATRRERQTANGTFVEPYIAFDCRPKINLRPYIDWVNQYL